MLNDMSSAERAFLLGQVPGGDGHDRDNEDEDTEGAGLASDPVVQSESGMRAPESYAARRKSRCEVDLCSQDVN